jgi:hypothetical protein
MPKKVKPNLVGKRYEFGLFDIHRHLEFDPDDFLCSVTWQRKTQKPRDSTNARGSTPAESARLLLQKRKFSRRINYKVVDQLFSDSSDMHILATPTANADDDKDDDDGVLYPEMDLIDEPYNIMVTPNGIAEDDDDRGSQYYYDSYVEDGYQEEV